MGTLLTLDQVCLAYDGITALEHVTLEVNEGEILGILGPNGSGKSSLLRVMCGMLPADRGRVCIGGKALQQLGRPEIAREIAMVSQESHFQFAFNVLEVVLMGRFPHLGKLQFEGQDDMRIAQEALQATQCLELADRSIHALSGGERQRVLIARALAQQPKCILFDEPTSFLDLKFKREIFRLIESLSQQKGMGVVLVSHDLDLAAQYCSRVAMLKQGAIYRLGTAEQVITSDNLAAVFDCPASVDINPATRKPRVNLL